MPRTATRASFLLVTTTLALLAMLLAPTTLTAHATPSRAHFDPVVGEPDCALVGRVWRPGYGCSRRQCRRAGDVVVGGRNSETCRRPSGAAYGTVVDPRVCVALHRRWLASVNYCASNARAAERIERARQCVAPFTVYVNLSESDGDYDECLRPAQVDALALLAQRTGTTLAATVSARSATLCGLRPGMEFVDGLCGPAPEPVDRSQAAGTLVIGDSITWRGTDELILLRPDWQLDSYPGRRVGELPHRIQRYQAGRPDPEVLVIALGTNTTAEWTKEDYLAAIDSVPLTRAVVLVTPYRHRATTAAAVVAQYTQWMREIALERSNVCISDWHELARTDPTLLIDGVHPTRAADRLRARMVVRTADGCLATRG